MNYLFVGFEGLKPGLGTGHIVRIKRLINLLRVSDPKVESITFITNMPEQSDSYDLLLVNSLKEASDAMISCVSSGKFDVAIFDCLDYCKSVYFQCEKEYVVTIGIDTSSEQSSILDILVNPVIENKFSHLTGDFYSIHNTDNPYQNKQVRINDKKSIFICFGGIDYQNHLAGLAPYISSFPSSYEINIILAGEGDVHYDHSLGDNVNLLYRPDNFYELLGSADIAIISGGILLQECLFMGIPAYVIPQYDHQLKVAKEKELAGLVLGVSEIQARYKNSVDFMLPALEDQALLDQLAERSRSSNDGYGLNRVTSILRLIDYMPWDSNFFGHEIFMLNTKSYTQAIKEKINIATGRKKIDLIYFLCPSSHVTSIDFALKDGFKCVDDRLTYLVKKFEFDESILDGNYCIKKSGYEDIARLEVIASQSKWTSRYFNDENFSRDQLKDFYSAWVKKSVTGDLDDLVFHIEDAGTIMGFVTIKKNGPNLGSIGLITVAEEAQGRRFGLKLAAYAVKTLLKDWGCAGVEVVTQKNNVPACRTYEKLGFKIFDNSTWMHKWI